MRLYLLDVYAKNEKSDLSATDKSALAQLADRLERARSKR